MQFIYDVNAGAASLKVEQDNYKYLFKARRHKTGDEIAFRNLNDENLYIYSVGAVSKKEALLELKNKELKSIKAKSSLHLIWSVVDPKTVEKQLPYLNELGVEKISFFYADYSQKNFKLNFDKFEKILINSSQQCGRSSIIQLEILDDLQSFLQEYPDTYMLNFSENMLSENSEVTRIVIGCEGGFSKDEIELFGSQKIVGLNSNLILRSETAVTVIASKLLV